MTKCVNCAKEMEKGSGESILSDVGLLCKECYAEREGLTIEEVEKQKKEQANTLKKEPQGIIDKLMNQPSFIDLLSLTIEDVDSAKKAARLGLYASMFVSAFGVKENLKVYQNRSSKSVPLTHIIYPLFVPWVVSLLTDNYFP